MLVGCKRQIESRPGLREFCDNKKGTVLNSSLPPVNNELLLLAYFTVTFGSTDKPGRRR
jgi:hypothetical protein